MNSHASLQARKKELHTKIAALETQIAGILKEERVLVRRRDLGELSKEAYETAYLAAFDGKNAEHLVATARINLNAYRSQLIWVEKELKKHAKNSLPSDKERALHEKIAFCVSQKERVQTAFEELEYALQSGTLSRNEFEEKVKKRFGSRTPEQWCSYYDIHIKTYKSQLTWLAKKRTKRFTLPSISPKKVLVPLFIVLLVAALFFFVIRPQLTGFGVEGSTETYTDSLNLAFTESDTYEWTLENQGTLQSVEISGEIEGTGTVRVYLDDVLILDSDDLEISRFVGISGGAITGFAAEGGDSGGDSGGSSSGGDGGGSSSNGGSSGGSSSGSGSSGGDGGSGSSSGGSSGGDSSSSSGGGSSGSSSGGSSGDSGSGDSSSSGNSGGSSDSGSSDGGSSESARSDTGGDSGSEGSSSGGDSGSSEDSSSDDSLESPGESDVGASEEDGGDSGQDSEDVPAEEEEAPSDVPSEEEPSESSSGSGGSGGGPAQNDSEEEPSEDEGEQQAVKEFSNYCADSCDLSDLALDAESYTLRIEVSNAELSLDDITYELFVPLQSDQLNETEGNATDSEISGGIGNIAANETLSNDTVRNESILNETIVNETVDSSPILLKNFSNYSQTTTRTITLQLDEFFAYANTYRLSDMDFITYEIVDDVITFASEGNNTGNETVSITAVNDFGEITSNEFSLTFYRLNATNVSVLTKQYKAVIGRPQKWVKVITANDSEEIKATKVVIPKNATNITIKTGDEVNQTLDEIDDYNRTVEETDREELFSGRGITGNVAYDINQQKGILTRFYEWLTGATITGRAISEEELTADISESEEGKIVDLQNVAEQTGATEVAVEYVTEGPVATEEEFARGKRVMVSADDELGFTDVLTFAEIAEFVSVDDSSKIKIWWVENGTYVDFAAHDLDSNGLIDYVEWITPHLSNQTFEIILITQAEHLDENRVFVSDIYDSVSELDGNWSETIPANHYVRVVFEINLTSDRDITVYPRAVNGSPSIIVYEQNESTVIASFDSLVDNTYNKVYLTGLNGSQDTFDLFIVNGSVEFDHIIDPLDGAPSVVFGSETPDDESTQSGNFTITLDSSDTSHHYSFVDFDSDLVLWMRMDDVDGSGDPVDLSSFSNNGSLQGSALINETGVFGNASWYDGVNSFVDTTDDPSFDFVAGFTICSWANPVSTDADGRLIYRYDAGSADGYFTSQSSTGSGAWQFIVFVGGSNTNILSDSPPTGDWQHVCGVRLDNGTTYLYVDGAIQSATDELAGAIDSNDGVRIGIDIFNSNDFSGGIDEVMMFNRSLNASEIGALYNATANQYSADFSDIENGTYSFKGYAVDSIGNISETEERTITVNTSYTPVSVTFAGNTPADDSTQLNTDINISLSSSAGSHHYSFVDFEGDLVGWWRMDDVDGSGDPWDRSRYSNNGTLESTTVINETGYFGDAAWFDGTVNTGIDLGSSADELELSEEGAGTIIAWIYPTTTGTGGDRILSKRLTGGYVFYLTVGNALAWYNGATGRSSSLDYTQNAWNFVAVTFNSSELVFYVNDTPEYEAAASAGNGTGQRASIGIKSSDLAGNPFNGAIDEVLVFNRSLTPAEISMIFNSTANQYRKNYTDLSLGEYTFTAYAVDSFGSTDSASRTVTIGSEDDVTAPTISYQGATPVSGSIQMDSSITVNLSTQDDFGDHYAFTDFDNDLFLWMRFDDVNGSGDPTDLSSHSHNGSTGTGDAVINETGYFGDAAWFDGTSYLDAVRVDGSNFESAEMSMAAWIYPRTVYSDGNTNKYIITRSWSGSPNKHFLLYIAPSNNLYFLVFDQAGGTGCLAALGTVQADQWQFVAAGMNATDGCFVYLDDSVDYSVNGSDMNTATITNDILIGARDNTASSPFNGSIDEVMIFNRSLGADEILAIYNATASEYSHDFIGLDEGTHTFTGYAVDRAGNMNQAEERTVAVDSFAPNVNFTSPTPANGSTEDSDSIYVNVSSSDSALHSVFVDFNNDLLYWHRFDDSNASGGPADVKGRFNGTIIGSALVNETGYYGNASHFDGNAGCIDVPTGGDLQNLELYEISWGGWFKAETGSSGGWIVDRKTAGTNSPGFDSYLSSAGQVNCRIANGASQTGDISLTGHIDGTWHHFTCVFERNRSGTGAWMGVYIDGQLNQNAGLGHSWTNANLTGTTQLSIGAYGNPSSCLGGYMNGSIDEVFAFRRALNSTEVAAIYNATVTQYAWNFTNLSYGEYDVKAYAVDLSARLNETETRTITLGDGGISDCQVIDSEGTYSLSGDITLVESAQTCFSIESNNVVFNGKGYAITTSETKNVGIVFDGVTNVTVTNVSIHEFDSAIQFTASNNSFVDNVTINATNDLGIGFSQRSNGNTISNAVILNSMDPLELTTAFNNSFSNITINASQGAGGSIRLQGNSDNNTFSRIYIYETLPNTYDLLTASGTNISGNVFLDIPYLGNYSISSNSAKIIIRNSTHGQIQFLGDISGSGTNFTRELNLGDNLVSVDSAANAGLDVAANVTLYTDAGVGLHRPTILQDGSPCVSCPNETSLEGPNVTFSVEGFSNYSVGENDTINPDILFVDPTPANNSWYNSTSVPVNLSTSDDQSEHYAFADVDGTLGLWARMEDDTGLTTDSSGNTVIAVQGSVLNNSGKWGKGFGFGGGAFLNATSVSAIDFDNAERYVWSFWVRPNDFATDQGLMEKCTYGTGEGYSFFVNQSGYVGVTDCFKGLELSTSQPLTAGTWNHVTLYYSEGSFRPYINGVTAGTLTLEPISDTTSDLLIGLGFNGVSQREFSGMIDELVFLSRESTQSEINSLINTTADPYSESFILAQGIHNVTGYAVDEAGNLNQTTLRTIYLDSIIPLISFIGDTPANGSSQTATSAQVNLSTTDTNDHYSFVDHNRDLALFMTFDALNSSGDVLDLSSYKRNGSLIGDAYVSETDWLGNGAVFDGTSDQIDTTYHTNFVANFTVSLWFKSDQIDDNDVLIGDYDTSVGDEGWAIRFQDNDLGFSHGGSGGFENQLVGTTNSDDGLWHHYVAIVNHTGVTMYYDGTEYNTNFDPAKPIGNSSHPLRIGASASSGGSTVNGTVNDVLIFNRSLSETEVLALYNSSAYAFGRNFTGLSEGQHNITGYVVDPAGNQNSTTRTFSVDASAPTITVVYPANNSLYNSSAVDYEVYLSEEGSWCGYSIDGAANVTMTKRNITYFNYTELSESAGSHTVTFSCNDTVGFYATPVSHEFLVDLTDPFVNLTGSTPLNNSHLNTDSFIVNLSSTDTNDHYSFVDFDEDLVLWIRMDHYSGSTLFDSSSYGIDADIIGDTSQTQEGAFGEAFDFDGTGDYLNFSGVSTPRNETTISVWIKPASLGENDYIATQTAGLSGDGNFFFIIRNDTGALDFHRYHSVTEGTYYTSSLSVVADEWNHVIFTYNGSNATYYVNGQTEMALESEGIGFGINDGVFVIGAQSAGGSNEFNGSIDEFIMLNRSVTATEALALYNASATHYRNTFSDLDEREYFFTGYAVDKGGNVNVTDTRFVLIDTLTPGINFTSPTPANASSESANSIYVNVSTTDANDHYTFVDFDDSLILWLQMDHYAGSAVYDNSSYGFHGTAAGNAAPITNGRFGEGFFFDGDDDNITLPNVDSLDFTSGSSFSWSFWMNPQSDNVGILNKKFGDCSANGGYALYINGSYLAYSNCDGVGDFYINSTGPITLNQWYHVVTTYTAGTVNLYINGIFNNSGNGLHEDTTSPIVIGAGRIYNENGLHSFNGTLDEVLYFNRTLNASEISALYNASVHQYFNNFTSLAYEDHTFTAYTVDVAGNVNQTEERTIVIDPTSVSSCTVLDQANTVYTQAAHIVPTGNNPCINITANNVTFNGNGYWIANSTFNATAVWTNGSYVTVQHTNISVVNGTGAVGIFYQGRNTDAAAINGTIFNNTIRGTGVGVQLNFRAHGNNISSNNISTSHAGDDNYGIYVTGYIENTLISNNEIYPFGESPSIIGVYLSTLYDYSHTNVTGNRITSTGDITSLGIYMNGGVGTLRDNIITVTTPSSTGINSQNGGDGIRYIINNTVNVTGSGSGSIGIRPNADNTILENNTLYAASPSVSAIAIDVGGADNVSLIRNIISVGCTSGTCYGVEYDTFASSHEGLVLRGNNFSGNPTYDLYVRPETGGNHNKTFLIDQPLRNYSFARAGGTLTVRNTSLGEIAFLSQVNGSGTNISNVVRVGNNSVTVEPDSNNRFNVSANITLYGVGNLGFVNPTILRDGLACQDCYNFTPLTSSTVIFNVSGWSNYSIGEGVDLVLPDVNFTGPTPSNGSSQLHNSIYVNVSSSDNYAQHYTATSFNNDLFLWWRMDEVNTTNVIDLSGNERHGQYLSTQVAFGNGYWGNGSYHNSTINARINYTVANARQNDEFTFSAWIYPLSVATEGIFYETNASARTDELYIEGGQLVFRYTDSSDVAQFRNATVGSLSANNWYHVVLARNNTDFIFYVNGQEGEAIFYSGGVGGGTFDDYQFVVGSIGTPYEFNGTIDEVLFYDRMLDSNEILSLYNASANQYHHNYTDLANGQHNFTAYAVDRYGNVNQTEQRSVTINDLPTIPFVTPLSDVTPTAGSTVSVTVNFTVRDSNGYADVDTASAIANFTRGIEGVRQNTTCAPISGEADGDDINFTCTIDMWYFDEAGAWNISVSAADTSAERAQNISTTFVYQTLNSIDLSPGIFTISAQSGAVNQTSDDDPLVLNNTGNVNFTNITMRGINLIGEQFSEYSLAVSNFTLSNETGSLECIGNALINATDVQITNAILTRGNLSAGSGIAQEQLYVCIPQAPTGLPSQPYSTAQGGSWVITTALAAFVRRRKKKKKKEDIDEDNILDVLSRKLRESYGVELDEVLTAVKEQKSIAHRAPIEMFRGDLSPAETLTKYLKENKKMKFSEIARLLGRDQRTVWINYRNAIAKSKAKISDTKSDLYIPLSIFSDRRLSVLESLVLHLRDKGMKNSEIAQMLGKDPRNVWTLYSRAIRKTDR